MRYAVDPAAVQALAREWNGAADALGHIRARVPEAARTGAGEELAGALTGFLAALRDCLTQAAAAAAGTAAALEAAAGAYEAADSAVDPARS